MSKVSTIVIPCPKCHAEGEFRTWESINADLNPEARDLLLSGKLFQHICSQCGETYQVLYPLLYHDMKNRWLIQFLPQRQTTPFSPSGFMQFGNGYSYRVTYDIIDLKEKIVLLEADLDDRAIEMVKSIIRHQRPDKAGSNKLCFERIFLSEMGRTIAFRIFDANDRPTQEFLNVSYNMYDTIRRTLERDGLLGSTDDWPEVNENWIRKKLSER